MKTILCIDRRSELDSLSSVVENAGYRVFAAENTGDALRIFLSQPVDGVLLRQHCCTEVEAHAMQQHMRRVAPEVPVLVFEGAAEVAQSALPWMESYMEEAHALYRTNA